MSRPKLRFTLWSLFIIVAIFAATFAGFRFGHERGYAIGQEDWVSDNIVRQVYDISFLIAKPGDPEFSISLFDVIKKSVNPPSWEMNDRARIDFEPPDRLIVIQTPRNHETIRSLLTALHDFHIKFTPTKTTPQEKQ